MELFLACLITLASGLCWEQHCCGAFHCPSILSSLASPRQVAWTHTHTHLVSRSLPCHWHRPLHHRYCLLSIVLSFAIHRVVLSSCTFIRCPFSIMPKTDDNELAPRMCALSEAHVIHDANNDDNSELTQEVASNRCPPRKSPHCCSQHTEGPYDIAAAVLWVPAIAAAVIQGQRWRTAINYSTKVTPSVMERPWRCLQVPGGVDALWPQ